ncbi:MAG: hypothetical protein QOJ12_1198, partial [Thermoleophilales bacterium]|nr:hypothetical protein [Thermoleophilales bacterium]
MRLQRATAYSAPWAPPAAAIVLAVVAVYALDRIAPFGSEGFHVVVRDWGGQFLCFAGTAMVAARACRPGPDRRGWTLLAVGLAWYSTANVLYVALYGGATPPLYIHVLWLAFYPFAFLAVVSLLRARVRPLPRSLWVDSLIGALALASVITVWVFPPLVDAYGGDLGQIVPLVMYPIGDAMLLTLAFVAISLTARRPGPSWLLLAAGLATLMVADTVIVVQGAASSAGVATLLDAPYPIGVLLIGTAALAVPRAAQCRPDDRLVRLVYPAASVVVALGLLVTDQFVALPNDRVILPLVVIAVAGIRAATTIADLRKLYESRRFERGFEDASIGMALVSVDLRWVRVNRALAAMLRMTPADLLGRPLVEVVHPDDRDLTVARRDLAVAGGTPLGREMRLVRADGRPVDVMATSSVVPAEAGVDSYFFSQFQDISERRRSERQKAAIAALGNFALVVADVRQLTQRAVGLVAETMGAAQAMLAARVAGGDDLRFEARTAGALPKAFSLPGGTRTQAGYTLLEDRPVISPDLATETRFDVPEAALEAGLREGASVPVRRRGGSTHVLVVHDGPRDRSFGDDDVRFLEAVANVLASALDRVDAEAELRRHALEDPLTGLANRALLGSQLEHELHGAMRHGGRVAVLLLDLDRFKYVNDTLGHTAGDELLQCVAVRLRTEVRDEDLVARLGGDEFVVVCTDPTDAAIAEIAQRIVDVMGEPFAIGERELFVSASVGVAVGGTGATAEGLLSDADAAMYRAKEGGGDRYEIFDAALRARLVRRVSTDAALRRALERDELEVRYQPIVEVATGRIAGYEALLRWH